MMKLFASLVLICVITNIDGMYTTRHPHLITHLPDIQQMPDFNMYAGYLEASNQSQHIFYWLNEEASDNSSNRLLIWLNGGPGCSSLYGLLHENGPFTFDEATGNMTMNRFSWNRFAHTLYIESPFNTGFSYSDEPLTKNQDDDTAATHLLSAIKNFFQVHPRYEDFDIFLAGESYAGIYIPTTVIRLLKEGGKLADKFKGIILGNPYLSKYLDEKSKAEYSYSHGFIGKEDYKKMEKFDCYNRTALIAHDNRIKEFCTGLKIRIALIENEPINYYNLYKKCWSKVLKPDDFYTFDYGESGSGEYDDSNATSILTEDADYYEEYEENPCYTTPNLERYFNRDDVKSAIHAENEIVWKSCNYVVKRNYDMIHEDMSWRIKNIINNYHKTVLLYYGNLDFVCNFMGGEEFVRGLKLKRTKSRRPFYLKRGEKETLAGYYEEYLHKLRFAVIKSAGHMAPQDRPAETYMLIRRWLQSGRHN